MKTIFCFLLIFSVIKINAQNHMIGFTGSGAATSVDSVMIENLITGEIIFVKGTDILNLKGNTGTTGIEDKFIESGIKIYPNPMIDNATIEIYPPVSGNSDISIFDMSGKLMIQVQEFLNNNIQKFNLTGLGKGFYIVNVRSKGYQISGKLISNGYGGTANIERLGNEYQAIDKQVSKSAFKGVSSAVEMYYQQGDRLKFTGMSGEFKTVVTGVIDQDKVITFDFIACKDGDKNSYPVVKIGTQTWMGENVRSIRYNNGDTLNGFNRSVPIEYYWYKNDFRYRNTKYGALYSRYAIHEGWGDDSRSVCPVGWHIPSTAEWTTLENYTGNDPRKVKEVGNDHWLGENDATDETGFTALPAGTYYDEGRYFGWTFSTMSYVAVWWTHQVYEYSHDLKIKTLSNDFHIWDDGGTIATSIRCIKD